MADKEEPRTGKFLGMSYDWRRPTKERYQKRLWNPDEPRLFTPRAFGWGYSVNFYRIFHRRHQ
ncbi:MAG: hypothetical protein JWP74_1436 [Marmoricola sp.]|nr:hypothetical protein [Marmoricola sp.]